jgi:NAD(P)H-hydrate epimerase
LGVDACGNFEDVEGATALVIGPGCSTTTEATNMIDTWLSVSKLPAIVDADALNIIAHEGWLKRLPQRCIITPHVGEFDRLFGKHNSSFDRLQTQLKMSSELKIFIVLKGAHTRITAPNGFVYFNSTGNPGMATSGSGDVLSGMTGSFLAQGYEPLDAAVLGVFLHGLAGDFAAESRGMDSMIARDIIEFIGDAYLQLRSVGNVPD